MGIKRLLSILFVSLVLLLLAFVPSKAEEPALGNNVVRHDLKVVLYPQERRFSAEDMIILPEHLLPKFRFFLHKGLEPSSATPGVIMVKDEPGQGDGFFESYVVKLPAGMKTFAIKYGGVIFHPVDSGKEQARGFSQTPGLISEEGVYLAENSLWYPVFPQNMVTFNLQAELPAGWDAVSQGGRTEHVKGKDRTLVRWESSELQDEIFLIAAQFTEYTQTAGRITAMAFLCSPDKELANKYLDATARYVAMYEKLIGNYPYNKFALVENFYETGFGMPSFTLLGSKVIRLPFIINSSYPHEILHNWWGNSVFPDYTKGNWSEGLTAYLSDHLIREQQGGGAEYRQSTLQKYTDYVLSGRDFPLTQFRSRHSAPSEAVGYGKALMLFHMLRQGLGDKTFTAGLQDFYRKNKFRFASFSDLEKSFEVVSGKDLKVEFDQWITRAGAPRLTLKDVKTRPEGEGYVLTAVIEQVQPGDAYSLHVPVAVTLEGRDQAYQAVVDMDNKRYELTLRLPSRPLRIDVDPEFDVFRSLDRGEIPPAISQALGSEAMLIILPSSAKGTRLKAYREFAKALSKSGPDKVEVKLDSELQKLPSDVAVTVLGWENRFAGKVLSALSGHDVTIDQKSVYIGNTILPMKNHSVVLTARNPENKDAIISLIASGLEEALPGLGRKLPHYHKYSYLGFEGDEPANVAKGRWPVIDSPMMALLPGKGGTVSKAEMGKLTARAPLVTLPQVFSSEKMIETIRFLSSDDLQGRGLSTQGIDMAAGYIAQKFKEAGLKPAGDTDGSYFQEWQDPENTALMKNVIGVVPGKRAELSAQNVVVGAHYDHLGPGYPGADDNASGVAVLIELANVLAKSLNHDRSVVFVAFTGEEAGKKGSKYYVASQKRYPAGKSIGMLNLDTVGRLGKKKLLVLGAGSAREWVHIFRGAGFVTGVDIETVSEELDSSDQKSFQEAGIPAVQLFSGPHLDYHKPTDTVDKIDPDGLVKVASITKEVVEYLAGAGGTLTPSAKSGGESAPDERKARKVSIGTIPDFAFGGSGCRISGVVPGSPAETCGLKEGDVIIRINSKPINGLKDLSDMLKSLSSGSRISIVFLRDGKETTVEAETVAR